jgi:hypothetical protein
VFIFSKVQSSKQKQMKFLGTNDGCSGELQNLGEMIKVGQTRVI